MDQPDMVRKVKGPFSDKLGRRWTCACGREHHIPTRWLDVGYGALERIPELLLREGWRSEVLLVADDATYEAAGRRVALVLREGRFRVKQLVFPLPLMATEEVATHLLGRVGGEAGLVAVGSGTVNDIVKWAAHRAGRPYIVIPTAASMNGYTSPVAALLTRGVKRTVPSSPPVGVSGDPEVVTSAPGDMAPAGYADLRSKTVADVDWWLSGWLFGGYYCHLPREAVGFWEGELRDRLPGIRKGDPDAVGVLLMALLDSGFGMTVAGTSSPASGGEHLISHWLDMTAPLHGRGTALHGAQVGVGTLIASALYGMILDSDPGKWSSNSELPSEGMKERYGPYAGEVEAELMKKTSERPEDLLGKLAEGWEEVREEIVRRWVPPDLLREELREAGAPTGPEELGITYDLLRDALLYGREVRGRWTVLDTAYLVGLLPSRADEALERAFGREVSRHG
ncbi:MAG TPA: iron-containing alcohol dehydrogenase [Candidatus Latescibacteria bacterium]|nr:iron-containing alcohol dehydrogenase [Candidatus Latescibacterota bacterium]